MKIASKIYTDNKNKSIYVVYTDGSRGFFGFEKFDIKDRRKKKKKMNKKQKVRKVKEWIKQGKIKPLGENSFSVPSEAFILGITPRLISEVLK
mgnify:CR=1 FL=1